MLHGDPTRVLVTSSRMPFSVDEIRKLGEAGDYEVFAADTFAYSPGSHSKYVVASIITPPPSTQPAEFIEALAQFIETHDIELLVPCFEEVFYIAQEHDRLAPLVEVFAPSFEVLARLHCKASFVELARELGLAVPTTHVVDNREDLRAASRELGSFFARPSFSRGGVDLYTNEGALAGVLELEDCTPTPQNPWLVQPFIRGEDVCGYAVAHHGRVAAHASYVHPKTFEGAGGITFESIDAPDVVEATRRLAEATGYHGQISVDFMRTDEGLVPIECNPRPTAGVTLMSTEMFIEALRGRGGNGHAAPKVVPAGERRMIGAALIRDMLVHWRALPSDLAALVRGGHDIYASPEDLVPALYQVLGYFHLRRIHREQPGGLPHARSDVIDAYFHGICWNGGPIP